MVARGVDREDPTTDNGQILVVTRSTKLDITNPKNSTKAQMDVSGWLIEDHSDRSVKITHIAQLDVKETLKPFISKILLSEMAGAPRAVTAFIDDMGYAPFFVRWGDGPAQLISDSESNLKTGSVQFKVNGNGEGTMSNGQQKCWLQYSEKMFERGVDIKVIPANSCNISRVDGLPRTLEFSWTEEVKEDGAKIIIVPARGDGAEDVYLDGKFLDRTVPMEVVVNGSGAGMNRKKAAKKEIVAAVVPVAAVSKKQTNGYVSEVKVRFSCSFST